MDHRYFENYLLNDTPVPREEYSAFQAHLQICQTCTALAELNRSLKHVVMAAPAPGFATRFQVRLAAQRKAQRRRYLFGILILLFSGTAIGLWVALPIISSVLFSPTALLTSWAQTLSSAILLIETIVDAANVIGRVAVGFIPAETFALAFGAFSLLSLGWMISIQKAMLPQSV